MRSQMILLSALVPIVCKTVEYNFTIGYFIAAPDGSPVNVLGVNGQVPSPTIRVTQGDTLVVRVKNEDPVHVHSMHWLCVCDRLY